MPRKNDAKSDEVYVRLKFAIEQWWEKNGHTIDHTSDRFKPKVLLDTPAHIYLLLQNKFLVVPSL